MAKRVRYRAVSPKGVPSGWRRSLGNAVRDAFYADQNLGRECNGVTVLVSCDLATAYFDDLVAKGWTFDVWRK